MSLGTQKAVLIKILKANFGRRNENSLVLCQVCLKVNEIYFCEWLQRQHLDQKELLEDMALKYKSVRMITKINTSF